MPVLWPPLVNVFGKFIHPGLSHTLQVLHSRDKARNKLVIGSYAPRIILLASETEKRKVKETRCPQAALAGGLLTARAFIPTRSVVGLAGGSAHILLPAWGSVDNMVIDYQSWKKLFSKL